MATAYRLDSGDDSISASRSNDGKTVTVAFTYEAGTYESRIVFDTADFMKFLSTLSKSWGK